MAACLRHHWNHESDDGHSLHFTRSVLSPPENSDSTGNLTTFQFSKLITKSFGLKLLSGAVRGRARNHRPPHRATLCHCGPKGKAQILTQNGGRVASRVRHSLPTPRGPAAELPSLDPPSGKVCADDDGKLELLTWTLELLTAGAAAHQEICPGEQCVQDKAVDSLCPQGVIIRGGCRRPTPKTFGCQKLTRPTPLVRTGTPSGRHNPTPCLCGCCDLPTFLPLAPCSSAQSRDLLNDLSRPPTFAFFSFSATTDIFFSQHSGRTARCSSGYGPAASCAVPQQPHLPGRRARLYHRSVPGH